MQGRLCIFVIFPDIYKPEIPEPVPSLAQHGDPIGGIRVFPAIKKNPKTVIRFRSYC